MSERPGTAASKTQASPDQRASRIQSRLVRTLAERRDGPFPDLAQAILAIAADHPDDWVPQLFLAGHALAQGQHAIAAEAIAKARPLGPPERLLRFWDRLLALDPADSGGLERVLRKRLAAFPMSEETVFPLSELLRAQGRTAKANDLLSAMVAANPKAMRARMILTEEARRANDPGLLLSVDQALPTDADLSPAELIQRITALSDLGQNAEACALAARHVDLWPRSAALVTKIVGLRWPQDRRAFLGQRLSAIGARAGARIKEQCVIGLLSLGLDDQAAALLSSAGDGAGAGGLIHAILTRADPPQDTAEPVHFGQSDCIVAARPGAGKCLLVFSGIADHLQLPLPLFHRLVAGFGVSIIYLADLRRDLYVSGIASLGADFAQTVATLKARVADLGATEIYTLGNSAGGFAAIRYGLALGAKGVFASGAPTNISEAFMATDGRATAILRRVYKTADPSDLDLRNAIAATPALPRIQLFYCSENASDSRHALYLLGQSGVTLHPLPGIDGHGVFLPLIAEGSFLHHMRDFLSLPPPVGS